MVRKIDFFYVLFFFGGKIYDFIEIMLKYLIG